MEIIERPNFSNYDNLSQVCTKHINGWKVIVANLRNQFLALFLLRLTLPMNTTPSVLTKQHRSTYTTCVLPSHLFGCDAIFHSLTFIHGTFYHKQAFVTQTRHDNKLLSDKFKTSINVVQTGNPIDVGDGRNGLRITDVSSSGSLFSWLFC